MLSLVFPTLIMRLAGVSRFQKANMLAWTLIALAVACILQSLRRGALGSGLLLPSLSSPVHLAPSLAAAQLGGMPLVAGMTVFSGICQALISPLIRFIKPLFSYSVMGVIILLVGIEIGYNGLHVALQEFKSGERSAALIALFSLMILTVAWRKGGPVTKSLAPPLVFAAALFTDHCIHQVEYHPLPLMALPFLPRHGWEIQTVLIPPFLAAAIAAAIRAVAGVHLLHETVEAHGKPRTTQGVLAEAASTILSGVAGCPGTCVALNSISVEKAAHEGNPRLSLLVALILLVAALFPTLLREIALAPGAAVGPLLIFYGFVMGAPGWTQIRRDQEDDSRLIQAGVPLILSISAIAYREIHGFSTPIGTALLGSMLTVGVFSTMLIRLITLLIRKNHLIHHP
jgi:NCS2 family nucleobase:cation symporter-2